MSKRGKVYKELKTLLIELGEYNIKANNVCEKLGKLPMDDVKWVLTKMLKSSYFNDLPGELPQNLANDLSNLEKISRGMGKNTSSDDDDLPF